MTRTKVEAKPQVVFDREHSHSSLNTYTACSQSYKYKYVDKLTPPLSDRSVAMDAGVVAHNALEFWFKLKTHERPAVIDPLLDNWWTIHLRDNGLTTIHDELRRLASDVNTLNKRIFYNKNGSVSKSPKATAEYRDAYGALNLGTRQAAIDQVAAKAVPKPWALVSLSAVFAESWDILTGWAGLSEVAEVVSVERHIRESDLKLPAGERFQVKIDLICRLEDSRLAVVDHKTGGKADEPPHAWEVANHDQLLTYGWALDRADGLVPDLQGIHHVRGGVLVVAEFDYSKAMSAVARKQKIISAINQGVFVQQSPDDFSSPCHNKFWNKVCPWLPVCHTDYYTALCSQASQDGKLVTT